MIFWVDYDGCSNRSQWNCESQAVNHAWELHRRGAKNIRIGNNLNYRVLYPIQGTVQDHRPVSTGVL